MQPEQQHQQQAASALLLVSCQQLLLLMQTNGQHVQVLTLPSFPVSVLGTVVNKRARYSYLRKVDAAESLTYRWAVPPAGGHMQLPWVQLMDVA